MAKFIRGKATTAVEIIIVSLDRMWGLGSLIPELWRLRQEDCYWDTR